jgi:hypothetical protein
MLTYTLERKLASGHINCAFYLPRISAAAPFRLWTERPGGRIQTPGSTVQFPDLRIIAIRSVPIFALSMSGQVASIRVHTRFV